MIEINLASIIGALLTGLVIVMIRAVIKRLDDMNSSISKTKDDLYVHKLWASEKYVQKDECKDHRDECPARTAP